MMSERDAANLILKSEGVKLRVAYLELRDAALGLLGVSEHESAEIHEAHRKRLEYTLRKHTEL